jgi:hypothetical protein
MKMKYQYLILFALIFTLSCKNESNTTDLKNDSKERDYTSIKDSIINSIRDSIKVSIQDSLSKDTNLICVENKVYPIVLINKYPLNWLLYGFDNFITINAYNIQEDSIIIKTTPDLHVIKVDSNRFKIKPLKTGRYKLKVFYLSNKKEVFLSEQEFQVKHLSRFAVPRIAGENNGDIEKNKLNKNSRIEVMTENTDIDMYFDVVEFTVSTNDLKGKIVENVSKSEKMTDAQLKQIESLKSGDKVYFEDIKIKCKDENKEVILNIGTIKLKIK